MNIEERISRYKQIEGVRKRPLIVYATSTRFGIRAQMARDAVREFIDQIDAIPTSEQSVDVLIHSTGGDGLTAWKLMSLLRERFKSIGVLVPFEAFSAATIFALGADEIVMHPHASLGPIDPQITTKSPDGKQVQFSYEDLGAFLRFLRQEAALKRPEHITTILEKLFSTIDPVGVGFAQRASELATDVGERLLLTHMTSMDERKKARTIAQNLNKSFFAHGDAVSRSRAIELGLKIAKPDTSIEKLIWEAFVGLEAYMQLRCPFNPLQHFLQDPNGRNALAPIPPLNVPPNTPQQLIQQILQQVAAQALNKTAVEVDYSLVNAAVESSRSASEFRTKGKITAWRGLNNEVGVSCLDSEACWAKVNFLLQT
jgi:hypothetical protein